LRIRVDVVKSAADSGAKLYNYYNCSIRFTVKKNRLHLIPVL